MKSVSFQLQICLPSGGEVCLSINASTPFMSLQKGDLFNPHQGAHFNHVDTLRGKILRIVNVEHGIQELDDEIRQYVRLYTEAVVDNEEARIPG